MRAISSRARKWHAAFARTQAERNRWVLLLHDTVTGAPALVGLVAQFLARGIVGVVHLALRLQLVILGRSPLPDKSLITCNTT